MRLSSNSGLCDIRDVVKQLESETKLSKNVFQLIKQAETDISNILEQLQKDVSYAIQPTLPKEPIPPNPEDCEGEDPDYIRQRDLKDHVQELDEPDGEGYDCYDPRSGAKYLTCDSCGRICDLEDYHSGGECNFCHAMNKD